MLRSTLKNFKIFNRFSAMEKIFKSRINPTTGNAEWVVEPEGYDFYQEIARSGYADMLHDDERNKKFFHALENVIDRLENSQKAVHVLDIGTGTGLLSMMAAKLGAERVTALEAFQPMAKIAKKIIHENGFSDKITVVSERSTDVKAISERANVCVAEVFDTELIGEGALRTFLEAHERLLEPGCQIIPSSAIIYGQVIESQSVLKWEKPARIQLPEFGIDVRPPKSCCECKGSASVHDVQLDQLPLQTFIPATEPFPLFKFNFNDPTSIRFDETLQLKLKANASAKSADAILFYWDLDMDGTGDIILSTVPTWMKGQPSQWRDHWMQAIYYLPTSVPLTPGKEFLVTASHDEYSFWFSAELNETKTNSAKQSDERPFCECGLHLIVSRGNLGRLNDLNRYRNIIPSLSNHPDKSSVLCISDCSLLPLIAAQLGYEKIITIEPNVKAAEVINKYALENEKSFSKPITVLNQSLDDSIKSEELRNGNFSLVIADPFYFSSVLPWHNLHFWYAISKLRNANVIGTNTKIAPMAATIWCMPMEFDDLWKIRAPVGIVEGFDLRSFDAEVQKAIKLADAPIEPHPLWEYPGIALSAPVQLFQFDLLSDPPSGPVERIHSADVEFGGTVHGIAIWIDWQFCESHRVSTGLLEPSVPGTKPNWDWYSQQGVYFLPYPYLKLNRGQSLSIKSVYTAGELSLQVLLCA